MKTVFVVIWEGISEIEFFKEFLRVNFWFITNEKHSILLENGDISIILAHPKLGFCHKWWENQFKSSLVYITIQKLLSNLEYKLWKYYEYNTVYLLLTDGDTKRHEEKKSIVIWNIGRHCQSWELITIFAEQEIESWFLAGIWNNLISKYPFLNNIKFKNTDSISNPKEVFIKLVNWTELSGNQSYIAKEFWSMLDIEIAKENSESFAKFINTIEEKIL